MKIILITTAIASYFGVIHSTENGSTLYLKNSPDPCSVTVTQIATGWEECNGTLVAITAAGQCTKNAENCDLAYVAARDCAQTAAATKLAAERQKVIDNCPELP